ncbi:MAG: hypothetical protein R8P61_08865 [Bacteroidia bacterium]|nr:hypothetical protein [Bacteroidia bacterium]
MKPTLLSILILFLFSVSQANILRVDNTPGSSAPYSDLTTAHAVALDGDTLYIEGSNTSYGNLILNKRLVILGPGYYLDQNPNTPVSLSAIVAIFTLERSDPNDPTSGSYQSEIRGLSFTATSNSGIRIESSEITIANCLIRSDIALQSFDINGIHVSQCYFQGEGIDASSNNPGFNGVVFINNIVEGNFLIPDNSTGTINHNLFLGDRFEVLSFAGELRSNIATSTNTSNFAVSSSGSGQISHNTAANGQFGTIDDNNISAANVLFVGLTGNSQDGQYQLAAGATAVLGNAHDATDRGPFGGNRAYSLSGLSDIPRIISLEVPPTGSASETFTIRVKARAGN